MVFDSVPGYSRLSPDPLQCLRKDRPAMLDVVTAFAQDILVVISPVFQCGDHRLVGKYPVAVDDVQVIFPILQEDSNGLRRILSDPVRVAVPAADGRKAADMADDLAEGIRPVPGGTESSLRRGARAADGVILGHRAQVIIRGNDRNQFLDQEAGEAIVNRKTAIITGIRPSAIRLSNTTLAFTNGDRYWVMPSRKIIYGAGFAASY